ncbi:MAG: hypothetical protein JSS66_07010 [Armatimonadetes bacterium]|nr:hypothetical protein [Armatimonadota bacterium]
MALTDASAILTISNAMGAAYASLLSTLDTGVSSSCLSKVAVVRQNIDSQQAEADFDAATTWFSAVRTDEEALPALIHGALGVSVEAANTYFVSETDSDFKTYWHARDTAHTVAFSNDFRSLWRQVREEELCVSLYTLTRGSSLWVGAVGVSGITLPSVLELRTTSVIGAASITATATLTQEDGTIDVVVVSIPAATAAHTIYALNSTTTYVSGTLSATGGTNGDVLELWVAP